MSTPRPSPSPSRSPAVKSAASASSPTSRPPSPNWSASSAAGSSCGPATKPGPVGTCSTGNSPSWGWPVPSSPRPSCRPNRATASKPIGATPRSSRAAIARGTSRRCGSRTPRTKPCGIWCADGKPWTQRHRRWLDTVTFAPVAQQTTLADYIHEVDHAGARVERLETALDLAIAAAPPAMQAIMRALQCLRGVRQLTAATIVSEIGPLSRFAHPRQLMGYSGTVPSEYSSGSSVHRGAITKTGNAHLRRVLVEAAWAYRFPPKCGDALRTRQRGQPPGITDIAWKAQQRLHTRYRRLLGRGKPVPHVITAVARELVGFIWAIGIAAEREVPVAA